MTLTTILLYIGIAAFLLTFAVGFIFRAQKNWLMSYLQNFCGAFFVFSGWVKAIDPLGTAYKMEQYFAEFETHFSWFSWLFPMMAEYALAFSVFMIVLEVVLGIMLIIGAFPKLSSWLFMGIVGFFTVLTGFTYLTGYVPGDATFFEFGKWGPYIDSNMKVTDCGCFGDFIKLKPFTTFMKDVCLLFPAIFFLFKSKDMHQLFSPIGRTGITVLSTIALLVYCFSNFSWNLPGTDFRPFHKGVNIQTQKDAESAAAAATPIFYELTNKASGESTRMSMNDYLKVYKDYGKEEWEIDQQRGEPTMPSTKISEYEVSDPAGNDITTELLSKEGYSFMVVGYKLFHTVQPQKVIYQDTLFAFDTIENINGTVEEINKRVVKVDKKELVKDNYLWDASYQNRYSSVITPLAEAAKKAGIDTYVITSYADPSMLDDFRKSTNISYPFYTADDILLKTIIRSNPGILLLKDGTIINKWHYKKLPSFDVIKAEFMK